MHKANGWFLDVFGPRVSGFSSHALAKLRRCVCRLQGQTAGAAEAGIGVNRLKIGNFVLSGALAGVAFQPAGKSRDTEAAAAPFAPLVTVT